MIYTLFILWISVLIVDIIPNKHASYILICALIASLFPTKFIYHTLPYGIEYRNNITFDYSGLLVINSILILSYVIKMLPELSSSIFILALGLCQICAAKDWFNLYIGFEIMLIGVILMCTKRNWEDLIGYFKIQILGTLVLLFGIIKLYSLNINLSIKKVIDNNLLLVIGLCIKSAIYPFSWGINYYNFKDKLIYFILTTIVSKATIYVTHLVCILDAPSRKFMIMIVFLGLINNMFCTAKAKSVVQLCHCSVIASILYMHLILLFNSKFLSLYYLQYTVLMQVIFMFNPVACLVIQAIPILSPTFIFKVIMLKEIQVQIIQLIILMNSFVFHFSALKQVIRVFIRARSPEFKPTDLIKY